MELGELNFDSQNTAILGLLGGHFRVAERSKFNSPNSISLYLCFYLVIFNSKETKHKKSELLFTANPLFK